MKIIRFTSIRSFIIVFAVCVSVSVCLAEETPGKPKDDVSENKTTSEKDSLISPSGSRINIQDWSITLGGTCSRPKLTKANRDIHAVESQLRQTAPGVEKFEDWDDIYKGTIRIGISRKLDIKNVELWPAFVVAYGKGSINTKQGNLSTIYAAPMNYSFNQTYEFYLFNLGVFAELFDWKGCSVTLGGYLTYGLLGADTDFSTNIPAMGVARHVKGNFREGALGYAAVCNFSYELPFLKGLGLSVAGRYDWLKFKGPTKVNDYQHSPLGTASLKYDQRSLSDMSGPSVILDVSYRF